MLQQKLGEEDVAAEPEDTADLEKVRELTKVKEQPVMIRSDPDSFGDLDPRVLNEEKSRDLGTNLKLKSFFFDF